MAASAPITHPAGYALVRAMLVRPTAVRRTLLLVAAAAVTVARDAIEGRYVVARGDGGAIVKPPR